MKIAEILTESTAQNISKSALEWSFDKIKEAGHPRADKIIDRVTKHIDAINTAFEHKEIINTQFESIKSDLNRFVDEAYSAVISDKYYVAGKYQSLPQEVQELYISPYDLRGAMSGMKKMAKLQKTLSDEPVVKDTMRFFEDVKKLADILDFLKSVVVKASAKKKEAKAAEEEEKVEFNKKYVNHKDVKKVTDLLKSKASGIEKQLYEAELKFLNRVVVNFKDRVEKEGISDYTKMYKTNPYSQLIIQGLVKRVSAATSRVREFELEEGWEDKIDVMAKRYASDVVDKFVYRNAEKLSFVLYTKNNMESVDMTNVSVESGSVECVLKIRFKDSSKFDAKTSVVVSYSKYGKRFYRYPTTFTNVTLPDGSKLSSPSEQRIDEVFAIA